jgi:hypothetical protein
VRHSGISPSPHALLFRSISKGYSPRGESGFHDDNERTNSRSFESKFTGCFSVYLITYDMAEFIQQVCQGRDLGTIDLFHELARIRRCAENLSKYRSRALESECLQPSEKTDQSAPAWT